MFSSSRGGAKVRLLAVHTTEGILRNADLKAFFDRPTAEGSCHAASDNFSGLREDGFVPYDRAAWTLRSGNPISDNIEQCGWAHWSRDEWLTNQRKLLEGTALWLAKRSIARGIPLRTLTHDQIRGGQAGVIQHNDWTIAMRDGSHWDCGPGYPLDWVVNRAREIAGQGTPSTPSTPTPTKNKDNSMTNYPITAGKGTLRLIVPTGVASMITARSFISATVNGPSKGSYRVFAQDDDSGIEDWTWSIGFQDGRSQRPWRELKTGTTQVNIQYDLPEGGTVCVETLSK